MYTKYPLLLVVLSVLLFVNSEKSFAQKKVVAKHGVEYLEDVDDEGGLNSITIPAKTTKAKKKTKKKPKKALSKEALAIKKLQQLDKKRKKLRFRNKRTKCLKDVKKQQCDSKPKK